MKKPLSVGILWSALLLLGLYLLNALLMPKYMHEIPEGALIAEYYEERCDHDVIFIGDCEVYENFSPDVLWNEYGITSFIRGSAQQLIWQSYYLMEETLRYETPEVIVFNVLSMKYDTPQSEAYNRLNLDGMRLSSSKWNAVRASMTEGESALSYLLPLLRYHARWQELSADDLRYLFHRDILSDSGYLMNTEVRPAENVPTGKPLPDYRFSDTCYDYLDKMVQLCKNHGVQLVLIKAPSLYPYWYAEWDAQMVSYAEENDLVYLNFQDMAETIGIDFTTDTYDGGLHLNVYGAEKMSHAFGQWLTEHTSVSDRRGQALYDAVWQEKSAAYAARKNRLEMEWAAESAAGKESEE